ncbi:MAG: glutamine amidotransferase-related protein, partial [Litorivicinaceae bacterium]
MTQTVAVIDYGMGNLHSVAKALEHAATDTKVRVTSSPTEIRRADRVVLPGVGALGDCMVGLAELGLDDVVHSLIGQVPLFGVCVGM